MTFLNSLIVIVLGIATNVCYSLADKEVAPFPVSINFYRNEIQGADADTEIKRSPEPPACNFDSTTDGINSGLPEEERRWRSGIVFQLDKAFTRDEEVTITNALVDLSQVVCIPFLMWQKDDQASGDYVFITRGVSGSGCNAQAGRQKGKQSMNLEASGCIHRTVVIHETIHALGFLHEHVRPDRDSFVNIFRENISPRFRFNFDIQPSTLTFGVPYNLRSIMHYSSDAFSSNGKSTILTKSGEKIPYNFDLTALDIQKLRAMYNC